MIAEEICQVLDWWDIMSCDPEKMMSTVSMANDWGMYHFQECWHYNNLFLSALFENHKLFMRSFFGSTEIFWHSQFFKYFLKFQKKIFTIFLWINIIGLFFSTKDSPTIFSHKTQSRKFCNLWFLIAKSQIGFTIPTNAGFSTVELINMHPPFELKCT